MLNRLYGWYGKRVVHGFFVLVALLLIIGISTTFNGDAPEAVIKPERAVEVARVTTFSDGQKVEVTGEVEAVDQAVITTEASGRVTNVNVSLGDRVGAGAVIATLENASERAAVLQAEGAYEAALASAAQSNVSVAESETALRSAENNAVAAFRNSYTTVNDVVRNLIDELFSDPDGRVPGLRIEGFSETKYLNNERKELESLLGLWQEEAVSHTRTDDLDSALNLAGQRTHRVLAVTDTFIRILPRQDAGVFTETELSTLEARFASARSTLTGTLTALENAETGLASAREALTRTRLGGSGGTFSASDAQVKQALGTLRSAQANLEKTILRSPIAGTVNSLSVKSGDFVGLSEVVARIANNDALEVTTYVTENIRGRISVGSAASINSRFTGTVTNIAPAIDPNTKKYEVRLATETNELVSGDTVRVQFELDALAENASDRLTVPITALKVETDRTVVFTLSAENTLIAHEVIEGPLVGEWIVIEEGLSRDMEIVLDARGLNEGDTVALR